jgi:hypothetical protein
MFPGIERATKSLHRTTVTDRVAGEVVDRSLTLVRQRLSGSVRSMCPAELRGYLGARALQPVRDQTRQLLARYSLQDSMFDDVVRRALERTVHLLVCESAVPPVVNVPAAHVSQRAAA